MTVRIVASISLALLALGLAACGGGGGPSLTPDQQELASLRDEAEVTYTEPEVERIITAALAIASRNSGAALGVEAFDFAEGLLLDRYDGSDTLFTSQAPKPPDIGDPYVESFRTLAGFASVVPAPYEPAKTASELQRRLTERADFYLSKLEEARDRRRLWATELLDAGSTDINFGSHETYDEYELTLTYYRALAVQARVTSAFIANWDILTAAATVATYEAPAASSKVEDGKIVYTYTEEAVRAGAANAEDLAAAVAAARAVFPVDEDSG